MGEASSSPFVSQEILPTALTFLKSILFPRALRQWQGEEVLLPF